jgi:hypothetical protein
VRLPRLTQAQLQPPRELNILLFAPHSGIPLFAQDMVGERSAVLPGDAQTIV